MKKFVIVSYVLSQILLLDYYVISPSIRLTAVPVIILAVLVVASGRLRHWAGDGKKLLLMLLVGLLYLIFTSSINFFRGSDLLTVFATFVLSGSMMIAVLCVRTDSDAKIVISCVLWCFIISTFFAALQAINIPIRLSSLAPSFAFIGSDNPERVVSTITNRSTGATADTIRFAMHAMTFLSFIFWALRFRFSRKLFLLFTIGIVAMIMSQTRAAIGGWVISAVFVGLLFNTSSVGRIKFLASISITVAFLSGLLILVFPDVAPYLSGGIEGGHLFRFYANWYTSLGVLEMSPLFGLSAQEQWDAFFRYGDVYYTPYYLDSESPTHHNQIAYVFRYYGMAGLLIFVWLLFLIFSLILSCRSIYIRNVILTIFLSELIYSLAHNNKLLGSPLFWIMLSLVLVSRDHGKRLDDAVFRGKLI